MIKKHLEIWGENINNIMKFSIKRAITSHNPAGRKNLLKQYNLVNDMLEGEKITKYCRGVCYSERGLKMYFWGVFHLHSDIYKTWCFYQQSIPIEFIPGILLHSIY